MTGHRHQPVARFLVQFLVAVFFMAGAAELLAQLKEPKSRPDFNAKMSTQLWPYEPPNQNKTKFEISGDEMTNVVDGVRATGVKIKYFGLTPETGPDKPQMIAETPSCVFDVTTRRISSTNLFQARSGDGNFYLEGVGFLWQQTSPDLTLSNDVYTIIHQGLIDNGGKSKTNSPQTDVRSRWATFDNKNGLVIYHEHVRVMDPKLLLTCVTLTVQLAQGGTPNQLDYILAETNVIMDFVDEKGQNTHATSDKALYTRTTDTLTNETLKLSGNPRLQTSNGWMTADVFVLNKATGNIQGTGNCHFHTRMNLAATGSAAAPAETEITSDNFDYDKKTGLAVFRGKVRVNNPQVKLACETLTASLPQSGAKSSGLDNIVAETNVAIDYFDDRGDRTHATSEKAVYSSTVASGVTNQVLNLTGNPVLERTNGWIMADLVSMDRLNNTIRGEGNVHTIFKKQSGPVNKTTPAASADSEIFSDHVAFDKQTGVAIYRGNVRVIDPRLRLASRQLTIKLPESNVTTNHATRPSRILAETNVIVDYFAEKGQKTHATGQKMLFTHTETSGKTNEVLELTGHPIIDMNDPIKGKTRATGDKVVYTSVTGGTEPSQLVTLSGHPHLETETPQRTMDSDDVIIYDALTGIGRSLGTNTHISLPVNPGPVANTNNPPAALDAAPH